MDGNLQMALKPQDLTSIIGEHTNIKC